MAFDLDALVLAPCHAAFGEANRGFPMPVYAPAASASFTINGVFRLPTHDAFARLADEPAALTTRKPEVDFRLSQFPAGVAPAQGDQVALRGVAYRVRDVRPDGNGLVTLELTEA